MVNLNSYVTLYEELDADNLEWKFDNWAKYIDQDELNTFMLSSSSKKDIKDFKELVDKSGINFNALTDAVNDEKEGLPDNYDNIYILKKIVDTINNLRKGEK